MRWHRGLCPRLVLANGLVAGCVLLVVAAGSSSMAAQPVVELLAVDAKIEAVWAHGPTGDPVTFRNQTSQSSVNIEAYLFRHGTLDPVPCDYANPVMLLWAGESFSHGPAVVPAQLDQAVPGRRELRTENGRTFPVWLWENAYIYGREPNAGPNHRTYYLLQVDGADYRTNVWVHGFDPSPSQRLRDALGTPDDRIPEAVDAAVGAIVPHNPAGDLTPLTPALYSLLWERKITFPPIDQVDSVDVGVDIAQHQSNFTFGGTSVGFGFANPIRLLRSLNDGYLEVVRESADAVVTMAPQASPVRPRWAFVGVDVATRDPNNRHTFAVEVAGIKTYTAITAYGVDVRTHFPLQDQPTSSCDG